MEELGKILDNVPLDEDQKKMLESLNTENMTAESAREILRSIGVPVEELDRLKGRIKSQMMTKKSKKIPVNSPCICGSDKKYKKCCGKMG